MFAPYRSPLAYLGRAPEGAYIRAVDTFVVPVPIARHFLQIVGQARHIWKVGTFCCYESFFYDFCKHGHLLPRERFAAESC